MSIESTLQLIDVAVQTDAQELESHFRTLVDGRDAMWVRKELLAFFKD